jgi:ubiquinone/menaquinone biosynthesis C-methylase UbiE
MGVSVSAYFDQYSDRYKELLAVQTGSDLRSTGFFATQKAHHLLHSLPRNIQVKSILDYGCGIGMSLAPLRLAFPEAKITGVDPSERSLEIAASEHPDANIELMPLTEFQSGNREGQYDVILLSCVLHHIEADQHASVLRGLSKVCAPSGRIAVVEHNPRNPLTRKIVRDCPFDEGVTLLSTGAARRLLLSSGWQPVLRKYITFVPPSLQRLKGIEEWLPWCPLGGQYMLMAQPS